MAASAAIAPEHVHEADAHHARSLTHRHFEAHDHEQTEIEPGDAHILWLSSDVASSSTTIDSRSRRSPFRRP
jgi:hypothetical protein